VESFVFDLGIRANKVQILCKDDSIEVKPKQWLDKKNWIEINHILLKHELGGSHLAG
jgi:hypothetical protein